MTVPEMVEENGRREREREKTEICTVRAWLSGGEQSGEGGLVGVAARKGMSWARLRTASVRLKVRVMCEVHLSYLLARGSVVGDALTLH